MVVILFFLFRFDGPGRIKFLDSRTGCIHGMAAIHMKWPFSFFLESGLDPCFFFPENENLHRNRWDGLCQFVHVCTTVDSGKPVFQFVTEMMQDIQTDQLLVSGMNCFAEALKRHFIENNDGIHDGSLGIDGETQPEIMQCPFCRDDNRCQKQIMRFDVGETCVNIPELIVSMEKLNLNVSRVF